MTYVKAKDIDMIEQDGTYQLSIGNHCVTGGNHKTADACYKSYVVQLLNAIDNAESALRKPPKGF